MQMGTWKLPKEWQVRFGWFKQFTAQERHNVAAHETINNYDRLLFMDTDQIYPPDYIEMMLAHEEPIVSGLNVSRYHPFEVTAYKLDGEENHGTTPVPLFSSIQPPDDQRIFGCDLTGTAALILDPVIFKKLPLPYFKDVFDRTGCRRLIPDDFYFCWQLSKAGIKITVDQNIVVKHIAKMVVSPYNGKDIKRAWDKVNSGHGYWKDGKR